MTLNDWLKTLRAMVLITSCLVAAKPANAIDIGVSHVTVTFDSIQSPADWATRTTGIVGTSSTAIDEGTLDAVVQTISAQQINESLPFTSNFPFITANQAARFNTTGLLLQTLPTGNAATVLLSKLSNTSGHYLTGLDVSYRLTENVPSDEEIPGHRVYYSLTGAPSSWVALGTYAPDGSEFKNLSISGLGTAWGLNTLYLLWADDNALAQGGGGEAGYLIDDMTFTPSVGALLPPPAPDFGSALPDQIQDFEAPSVGLAFNHGADGAVVQRADGPMGVINNSLTVNNRPGLDASTELVDLRGLAPGQQAVVGIDLKAWETAQLSDFELDDRVAVLAQYSIDGMNFTTLALLDIHGAVRLEPFDPLVPNPADQIRAAFPENMEFAPFHHYEVVLPEGAQTVRLRVIATVNSATEFVAIDNLSVTVVPEPASIAMLGLGLLGVASLGVIRRRANV